MHTYMHTHAHTRIHTIKIHAISSSISLIFCSALSLFSITLAASVCVSDLQYMKQGMAMVALIREYHSHFGDST